MGRKWVVNASPLIVLAKINQVTLIQELCEEWIIPIGVLDEINLGPEDDPARLWLQANKKGIIKKVAIVPQVASWDLGQGETEVLSWAYSNPDYKAILDDRAARNCAVSLNVTVKGTIGVLLLAKQEKKIKRITPLLEQVQQVGLRIDPQLLSMAKNLANESG